MPLARLITRTPEDATAASEYLLAQGYTVETVSPAEFHIAPAEIELNLEGCRPQEAVARAKALVEAQPTALEQAEEAAALEPDRSQAARIAVAYDITGRPVEFAGQEETAYRRELNRMGRALASLRAALAGAWQSVKGPVRGPQRRRAEKRALKLEAELAREQNRREEELARERLRQQMDRQQEEEDHAKGRRHEEIVAEQQARVAAVHEAMIAAERDVARQQQPQPVDPPALAVAAEVRQPPAHRSPERARPLPERRKHAPRVIVRRVVATAFVASLLLLLAFVAYANRRPASPLAPGALMRDGWVKQGLPFGPATITPPPAAVVSKPSASVPAKASPVVQPATRKPSAGRRDPQAHRRSPRHDSSAEEDEVVVRRLTPPRARPQPSTAKLKQHSDTD
jgi:hypothetical protein